MSKTLSNNQLLVSEIITQEYNIDNTYQSINDYFEFFACSQVLKPYDFSSEEIENGIVGGGNDGGCDGIYVLLNNELLSADQIEGLTAIKGSTLCLIIVQAKKTTGFSEDAIMKWKTVSENLLDMNNDVNKFSQRYSESVRDGFMLFRDAVTKLIRAQVKIQIKYYYVTLATEKSLGVSQQAAELCGMVRRMYPMATTDVFLVGADLLMELYNKELEETTLLTLADNPIALGRNDEYVALVNLGSYYQFIIDNEGNLKNKYFEANVRDYQGKNAVNSSIADSLSNNSGEDFWWLNNGVTILAEKISPITTRQLQIVNPEIVNGLQTSTEIYNYFSNNKGKEQTEKRNVLIRLIVPNTEQSRDNIIFATNNQTNIPKSSLRVTDEIHLQIEMYLKSRGLYYDRRKNHYKNQNKNASDIISVSFLAQCLISILLRQPDSARARPSTLLTNDETYDKLYAKDTNLNVYFNAAQIGRKIQLNVKKTAEYTPAERSDVLFYIVYGVVAILMNRTEISLLDLQSFDTSLVTDNVINSVKERVYRRYKELGGNGRVAKSSNFVNEIDAVLGLNT